MMMEPARQTKKKSKIWTYPARILNSAKQKMSIIQSPGDCCACRKIPIQVPQEYMTCSICLRNMNFRNMRRLWCGHAFHAECHESVFSWNEADMVCPDCNPEEPFYPLASHIISLITIRPRIELKLSDKTESPKLRKTVPSEIVPDLDSLHRPIRSNIKVTMYQRRGSSGYEKVSSPMIFQFGKTKADLKSGIKSIIKTLQSIYRRNGGMECIENGSDLGRNDGEVNVLLSIVDDAYHATITL